MRIKTNLADSQLLTGELGVRVESFSLRVPRDDCITACCHGNPSLLVHPNPRTAEEGAVEGEGEEGRRRGLFGATGHSDLHIGGVAE